MGLPNWGWGSSVLSLCAAAASREPVPSLLPWARLIWPVGGWRGWLLVARAYKDHGSRTFFFLKSVPAVHLLGLQVELEG